MLVENAVGNARGGWERLRDDGEAERYRAVRAAVERHAPDGFVLDVGCSQGILQEGLRYRRYVGVDRYVPALRRARGAELRARRSWRPTAPASCRTRRPTPSSSTRSCTTSLVRSAWSSATPACWRPAGSSSSPATPGPGPPVGCSGAGPPAGAGRVGPGRRRPARLGGRGAASAALTGPPDPDGLSGCWESGPVTPPHALVVSGAGRHADPWHPFPGTSAALADALGRRGDRRGRRRRRRRARPAGRVATPVPARAQPRLVGGRPVHRAGDGGPGGGAPGRSADPAGALEPHRLPGLAALAGDRGRRVGPRHHRTTPTTDPGRCWPGPGTR